MESVKKAAKPRAAAAKPRAAAAKVTPALGGVAKTTPPAAQVARTVSAAHEGFRRAGRAWCKAPTVVQPGELSDAQWAAIEADPLLTVGEVA